MPEHSTVILCSNFDPQTRVVCDQPVGHDGAHRATVIWGDEDYTPLEDES